MAAQRWRGLESIPNGWGRCVATIGVFDGVHRGHQRLIARTNELAAELGLPSVLLTFTPHPSEVVRPGSHPPLLTTNTRKAELAAHYGVDVVVFIPFTLEFSRLSPEEFVHQALVADLHAAAVVVGENFRFGAKAAGDVSTLIELGRRWGFRAEGVGLLIESDTPISSTYIRSCVEAGDMAAASHALGRPHRLDGVVIRGDQRGRDLGFPTANVRAETFAAVPADGVYAGRIVRIDEWGNTRTDEPSRVTAISVGTNPTFDGRHRSVEAYILDFDADLYGQNLGVEFIHRLRGMVRFDSIGELVVQMADDVEQTRNLLA
ncbi:bifunctional riboflavin kinase/FAD synthetase [Jatrophihabitans telluris]|uniref:Riboflavin biosynthesis protein n=1 Tax=Jatrophihabitans telluris TaxID=2038343 RepID=A0ABY4QSP8_9ACTN|nr:bifunctional riboflavin kinase/FAD synthetase [Jatrophihabitans telluris]UQX86780.1 bifunctional riboflavin kinase/FAD synthetase [Jatrophihabitans telluris]